MSYSPLSLSTEEAGSVLCVGCCEEEQEGEGEEGEGEENIRETQLTTSSYYSTNRGKT